MKAPVVLSLFLFLKTPPISFAYSDEDSRHRGNNELAKEFKERRKHKSTSAINKINQKDGYLRKRSTPDGSNAAASRLSLTEMESVALDMKAKLQQSENGEIKLKDVQKERFRKFIGRYEELKAKYPGGPSSLSSKSALQSRVSDPSNREKLDWYKRNRHREEFKETRGLVLGKTPEEREEVAEHIRIELSDHEAGRKVMNEQLYEFKKNALTRYDKANHPENLHSSQTSNADKADDTETDDNSSNIDEGNDDKTPNADEEAVSDGKTTEGIDPGTLDAPPRKADNDLSEEMNDEPSGVIVHGEEVKRRGSDEAPTTENDKETYRKNQAGKKKITKTLHDG